MRSLTLLLLATQASAATWCGASGLVQTRKVRFARPAVACTAPPTAPSALALVQGAVHRTIAGTAAGGAAGVALHAGVAGAAPAARGLVDGALNLVDISGGLLLGVILGVLWASEALLLGTGVISRTIGQATGLVGEDIDRAAGESLLTNVRASLDRLRKVEGVQGVLLRAALDLGGVTSDPGVAKLAEAAEAARKERDPLSVVRVNEAEPAAEDVREKQSLAGILGSVVEATLEARLFELRVALIAVAIFLIGGIDAVLLVVDGLGR